MGLTEQIREAAAVVAVGARTHWGVGGSLRGDPVEVHAPGGVLAYDPADLTVTVGAGTAAAELSAALAEHDQDAVLDPADGRSTVGGILATGLSGPRRLRYGPLRDRVLEVRFVTGDGRLVKGGGPTVKNVTGYDLPRLLVGSLGTLGVITQVTLRLNGRPRTSRWFATDGDPFALSRSLHRPACIAWDGHAARVLLEGHPDDLEAQRRAAGLEPVPGPPPPVDGAHRGRISVRPGALAGLRLGGCSWLAEVGVGTVHVGAPDAASLAAARDAAHAAGGWMLVEQGGDGLEPWGRALPNVALLARLKAAFDPEAKLAPGRLPLTPAPVSSERGPSGPVRSTESGEP